MSGGGKLERGRKNSCRGGLFFRKGRREEHLMELGGGRRYLRLRAKA